MSYKTGQVSIEFLLMIAFGLLMLSPILLNAKDISTDIVHQSRLAQAEDTLKKLKNAAELVHAQGSPARITKIATVPLGTTNTTVSGREISIAMQTKHNVIKQAILDFNVSGEIPTSPGSYEFLIIAEVGYVNISTTN